MSSIILLGALGVLAVGGIAVSMVGSDSPATSSYSTKAGGGIVSNNTDRLVQYVKDDKSAEKKAVGELADSQDEEIVDNDKIDKLLSSESNIKSGDEDNKENSDIEEALNEEVGNLFVNCIQAIDYAKINLQKDQSFVNNGGFKKLKEELSYLEKKVLEKIGNNNDFYGFKDNFCRRVDELLNKDDKGLIEYLLNNDGLQKLEVLEEGLEPCICVIKRTMPSNEKMWIKYYVNHDGSYRTETFKKKGSENSSSSSDSEVDDEQPLKQEPKNHAKPNASKQYSSENSDSSDSDDNSQKSNQSKISKKSIHSKKSFAEDNNNNKKEDWDIQILPDIRAKIEEKETTYLDEFRIYQKKLTDLLKTSIKKIGSYGSFYDAEPEIKEFRKKYFGYSCILKKLIEEGKNKFQAPQTKALLSTYDLHINDLFKNNVNLWKQIRTHGKI